MTFIKNYVGIPIGQDTLKTLIGGIAGYMLILAIKTGGRFAYVIAASGGILSVEGIIDGIITVTKIFRMKGAANQAKKSCCKCI